MKKTLLILVMALAVTLGAGACEPRSGGGSVHGAIRQYFPEQYNTAVRIATCESNLNPRAVSPTNDHGLFQINYIHRSRVNSMGYSWSQIYDPYVNARVARSLYNESGWRPWTCARL